MTCVHTSASSPAPAPSSRRSAVATVAPALSCSVHAPHPAHPSHNPPTNERDYRNTLTVCTTYCERELRLRRSLLWARSSKPCCSGPGEGQAASQRAPALTAGASARTCSCRKGSRPTLQSCTGVRWLNAHRFQATGPRWRFLAHRNWQKGAHHEELVCVCVSRCYGHLTLRPVSKGTTAWWRSWCRHRPFTAGDAQRRRRALSASPRVERLLDRPLRKRSASVSRR